MGQGSATTDLRAVPHPSLPAAVIAQPAQACPVWCRRAPAGPLADVTAQHCASHSVMRAGEAHPRRAVWMANGVQSRASHARRLHQVRALSRCSTRPSRCRRCSHPQAGPGAQTKHHPNPALLLSARCSLLRAHPDCTCASRLRVCRQQDTVCLVPRHLKPHGPYNHHSHPS